MHGVFLISLIYIYLSVTLDHKINVKLTNLFFNNNYNSQVCLIPDSAHGTNPASAAMAGLKVVAVPTNKEGIVPKEAFNEKVQGYI